MHPLPLALVVLSALAHVFWNYQIKRSPVPAICTWLVMAVGGVLATPVGLWLAWPPRIPPAGWGCALATGVLYTLYFSSIALSYKSEDLSRAYPISRGVAPVATLLWASVLNHEHPKPGGLLGILGVSLGVLVLALPDLRERKQSLSPVGMLAAVGTGLCISGYSAVDKVAVNHVHPALYLPLTFALGAIGQGVVLFPTRDLRDFMAEARRMGWRLVAAAAASMGGYLLVLYVYRTEPVSYVVPIRSVSVLFSVLAGSRLLGEKGGWSRIAAACLILLGISVIALRG